MSKDFKKCKFVMLDTPSGELPILIPLAMPHDYFKAFVLDSEAIIVSSQLSRMKGLPINAGIILADGLKNIIRPISAGFFDLKTLTTYGESIGLGLKPRPEDAETIKVFFNLK